MSAQLREQVLRANLALGASGLVTLTWGNVSAIDRDAGIVAIKPSGVEYSQMTAADIVLVDLDGNPLGDGLRPSSDTPTHVLLYRELPQIGAVVHTHSRYATAWAQAEREIPPLGTTHADLTPGPIRLTRRLTQAQVDAGYEAATGEAIVEAVGSDGPEQVPCVLVRQHGPFCWGPDLGSALDHAVTLEEVARLATLTMTISATSGPLDPVLQRKHFERKHGPSAYYGQAPHAG